MKRSRAAFAAAALLALLLAGFNCFWNLGSGPVEDVDEARHGVTAAEMVASGDPILTTYLGLPDYYNLKPPLGHWLNALSMILFGQGLFALRLSSALFALGTVVLAMVLAGKHAGEAAALVAGVVLATTNAFLFRHCARTGDFDAGFIFLSLLSLLLLDRAGDRPRRWLAAGFAAGLAFMMKSFAVLPLVAATVLFAMATGRRTGAGPRQWAAWVGGLALPIVPWMVARYAVDGTTFLRFMVSRDLLDRSVSAIEGMPQGPLHYAGIVGRGLGPWKWALMGLCLLALAGWALRRREAALDGDVPRIPLVILLWGTLVALLHSLAGTQLYWYMNPVYPAAAILGGCLAAVAAGPGAWRMARAAAVVVLVLGALAISERSITEEVAVQGVLVDPIQEAIVRIPDADGHGATLYFGIRPQYSWTYVAGILRGIRLDIPPIGELLPPGERRPLEERARGGRIWGAWEPRSAVAMELALRARLADGKRRFGSDGRPGDLLLVADGEETGAYLNNAGVEVVSGGGGFLIARKL